MPVVTKTIPPGRANALGVLSSTRRTSKGRDVPDGGSFSPRPWTHGRLYGIDDAIPVPLDFRGDFLAQFNLFLQFRPGVEEVTTVPANVAAGRHNTRKTANHGKTERNGVRPKDRPRKETEREGNENIWGKIETTNIVIFTEAFFFGALSKLLLGCANGGPTLQVSLECLFTLLHLKHPFRRSSRWFSRVSWNAPFSFESSRSEGTKLVDESFHFHVRTLSDPLRHGIPKSRTLPTAMHVKR